jgi:hypothetical protein
MSYKKDIGPAAIARAHAHAAASGADNALRALDGQLLSALLTTSLKHTAAEAGTVALQKAVRSCSLFLFWLIGFTHT